MRLLSEVLLDMKARLVLEDEGTKLIFRPDSGVVSISSGVITIRDYARNMIFSSDSFMLDIPAGNGVSSIKLPDAIGKDLCLVSEDLDKFYAAFV